MQRISRIKRIKNKPLRLIRLIRCQKRLPMFDLIYLAIGLAFFLVSAGLVYGLQYLQEH